MAHQHLEGRIIPSHLTEELFPGLTYEEALHDQEMLYGALKKIGSDPSSSSFGKGRSTGGRSNCHEHVLPSSSWEESYIAETVEVDSHLDLDLALARSLQDLEYGIGNVVISDGVYSADNGNTSRERNTSTHIQRGNEHINTATRSSVNSSANASASSSVTANTQHVEDDIDPDEMTYEELQSLGEAIGSHSKGLSEEEISSLPSFKYKCGYFSKKTIIGECVICYSSYERKQYVTTLPCAHQYHSDCIKRWLGQNKSCPICQTEVTVFH